MDGEGETATELHRAERLAHYGDLHGAIERVRRVLSTDPADGAAHALLAQLLLMARRPIGAKIEALLALEANPNAPNAQRVLGQVAVAERRFADAELAFRSALEHAPEWAAPLTDLARLRERQGRRTEALPLLREALALEPEDPDVHAELAWHLFELGKPSEAWLAARSALELSPVCADAHAIIGFLTLTDGHIEAARESALDALRIEPNNARALHLLASVKARSNWFLGAWWRFSVWMEQAGEGRSIAILLGVWFAAQFLRTWLTEEQHPQAAEVVGTAWLFICAYTWIAPGIFRRSLQRELGRVVGLKEF